MALHAVKTERTTPAAIEAAEKIERPTPAAIEARRRQAGLTQSAAAALVHSSLRGWQQWEAGHRKMHPAFWELFLYKVGLDTSNIVNLVNNHVG